MKLTQKQQDMIEQREIDIDMAFEYNDLSYLNIYPDDYNGGYELVKESDFMMEAPKDVHHEKIT